SSRMASPGRGPLALAHLSRRQVGPRQALRLAASPRQRSKPRGARSMSNLQTKMAVVPDAPGAAVLAQAFCSARRTPPRWASLSAHMPMDHRQLSLATFLVCVSASFYTFAADIPRAPAYDASLRNLMVVVRETVDA